MAPAPERGPCRLFPDSQTHSTHWSQRQEPWGFGRGQPPRPPHHLPAAGKSRTVLILLFPQVDLRPRPRSASLSATPSCVLSLLGDTDCKGNRESELERCFP